MEFETTGFQPTLNLKWEKCKMKPDELNLTAIDISSRPYAIKLMQLFVCQLTGKQEWREVRFDETV